VLLSAKPDWWTMTGFKRIPEALSEATRACSQSWILIPGYVADQEREESARGRALSELHAAEIEAEKVQRPGRPRRR